MVKKVALVGWAWLACVVPLGAQQWTQQDIDDLLELLPPGASHRHEMMPMRDGARLSTHFFLPAGHETTNFPVLLMRSAYDHWTGVNRSRHFDIVVDNTDTNIPPFYRNGSDGYVIVLQDLRGDGDSEPGTDFEPRLSINEVNDTYDTVEAISTNAWCNGRVGMRGGSGHGMAAYMGWLSGHSNLVVVAPANTAPSLYAHWSFENGVRRWVYRWLSHRNMTVPTWPKPTLGDYSSRQEWLDTLAAGVVGNETILIHDADRWFNFFLDATFEVFSSMSSGNRGYLRMDRGNHQGEIDDLSFPWAAAPPDRPATPSFLDILDGAEWVEQPFLDYYVLGDARRENAAGNFRRLATHWPPPAIPTPWYLHADGTLSTNPPVAAADYLTYTYHPTNPVPTVGGNFSYGFENESGPFNQLVPELTNRTDILRFVSEPFTEPTEITGHLQAELYISTDVEDTTFMVKLIDIYPAEGEHEEYHAIIRESAIMGRYWDGFDNPQPLVSGTVYRLDIDMSSIALMIETNHRLAVHITSSSDPAFEVHPNTYEQVMNYDSSPTATVNLHLNTNYPSRIILPHYTTNAPTVNVSTNVVYVPEEGTETFDVWMSGPALNEVTLTVERIAGDPDITVQSGASLTFPTNAWEIPQTVTLAAAKDDDFIDGTATIRISGPGVVPAYVTAIEMDNDVGLIASVNSLYVDEGATNSFTLVLSREPANSVTVTVSRISGSDILYVDGADEFVFTPANWSTPQTVYIASGIDEDQENDVAVFRCASPDVVNDVDIEVTQIDKDRTLVAEGKLMAWEFTNISPAANVPETNAYFVADGLLDLDPAGVLKASEDALPVTIANAVGSRGHNVATLEDALASGRYYSWIVEPAAGHDMTLTSVTFRTKSQDAIQAVLFSSVTGFDDGDELASAPADLQFTTVDLSSNPVFANLDEAVEFRIYGYGAGTQWQYMIIGNSFVGSSSGDDIQVFGQVFQNFALPELEVSTNSILVPEGGTESFSVRFEAEPTGVWTVATTRVAGDADFTVASGASLVFDQSNWSDWQEVVIAKANDADFIEDTATFRSLIVGTANYADIAVTEIENDLGVELSVEQLAIHEGTSSNMQVRLPRDPGEPVEVTITKEAGDPDLTLTSSSTLSFNSANWSDWQTVTFAAAEDDDAVDGAALFRFGGGDLIPVYLRVTEIDNDDPPEGMIGPPRADWRLLALDADASSNGTAIRAALTNGTDGAMATGGQTAWISAQIPPLANPAMLTFEADTLISGAAIQSFDSTDGVNGTWEAIPLEIYQPNTGANRLQKLDIDWGPPRWIRLAITNNSATAFNMESIGLYQLEPGGWNDYWVIAGASIQEWSVRNMTFKGLVQTNYNHDPVIFNVAIAGYSAGGIRSNLGADLARHPHARYIALAGGGNNITANRPWDGGATTLSNDLRGSLEMIVSSNRVPILARLSFRIYTSDPICDPENVPGSEIYGSLPYVENIYDPLIAEFCPLFIDPNTGKGRVDGYTHFFENQHHLSHDGVHPNADGQYAWNVLWAEGAGAVVYSTNYTMPIAIETSDSSITLEQGETETFQVRLAAEPEGVVTAAVARTSGNENLTVQSGAELVFDETDWDVWQAVTIAAAVESGLESAVFTVSGLGLISATVTAQLPAAAGLLYYEGFDYEQGINLHGANGGEGWGGAWDKGGGIAGDVLAEGLTYADGDRDLVVEGRSAINANAFTYYVRPLSETYASGDDITLWISFLAYGVGDTTRVIEFTDSSGGQNRLSIGTHSSASGEWQAGVQRYSGGTSTGMDHSTNAASPDLIVARLQLNPATDDVFDVWVNPSLDEAPSGEGDARRTGNWSFDRLRFIAHAANSLGIDEIRIGQTWAGVTLFTGGEPEEQYNDGVPFSWLELHNYDPETVDVNSVMASNLVNTLREAYIADLDPNDPASLFVIANPLVSPAGFVLEWSDAPGRLYSVHFTTNLVTADFILLASNIVTGVYTDNVHVATEEFGYYQIGVQLAE